MYKIEPGSVDAYTRDYFNSNFSREVRIKYVDELPEITEETRNLYKKILDIEKKKLHDRSIRARQKDNS